jgi:nucleoporin SEH1
MIQTGLIPNAHNDLVTDAVYDFYGLKLATCGLDQRYVHCYDHRLSGIDGLSARLSSWKRNFKINRIKIWQLDETNGSWSVEDDWKAHDATISKLSWAHPEFGTVIASAGFDRVVKVWERVGSTGIGASEQLQQPGGSSTGPSSSRWTERAVLADARGTVRAVEFAPHQLGLKLVSVTGF